MKNIIKPSIELILITFSLISVLSGFATGSQTSGRKSDTTYLTETAGGLQRITYGDREYKCKYAKLLLSGWPTAYDVNYYEPDGSLLIYDTNAVDTNSNVLFKLKHIKYSDLISKYTGTLNLDSSIIDFSWKEHKEYFIKHNKVLPINLVAKNSLINFINDTLGEDSKTPFKGKIICELCSIVGNINNITFQDSVLLLYSNVSLYITNSKFKVFVTNLPNGLYLLGGFHFDLNKKNTILINNTEVDYLQLDLQVPMMDVFLDQNIINDCYINYDTEKSQDQIQNNVFKGTFYMVNYKTDNNIPVILNNKFEGIFFNDVFKSRNFNFEDNLFVKNTVIALQILQELGKDSLYPKILYPVSVSANVFYKFKNATTSYNSWYNKKKELTEMSLRKIISFLDDQIKFVKNDSIASDNLKSKALERLEYQIKYYELLFKRDRVLYHFDISELPGFIYQSVVFITVNFGYNGEGRFSVFVLAITLLFSFIFNLEYYNEINSYYYQQSELKSIKNYLSIKRNRFLKFFQAYYFSFVVLISPKFPVSYFQFSNKFLKLITILWTIGIILVALFIVFIASKYSFVKTLIGL